jgi:hypothetical protein
MDFELALWFVTVFCIGYATGSIVCLFASMRHRHPEHHQQDKGGDGE